MDIETEEIQSVTCFPLMSREEIDQRLDPDSPECPFHKYVGNRKAVDEVLDLIYSAFERKIRVDGVDGWFCDRMCPRRIALLGPASVGKTTFCRLVGETLDLPYCETVADEIDCSKTLFERIRAKLDADGPELVELGEYQGRQFFRLPPMVLSIDEIGIMAKKVQESLLKMLESKDGLWLFDGIAVDCRQICVIVATTSQGRLGDAFKTRFDRIVLKRYTPEEQAKIIEHNIPGWKQEDYLKVARLVPVPREAIKFAEAVVATANRRRMSVSAAIKLVADRKGIYDGGVTALAVEVLKLLKAESKGLSINSICRSLGIEESEWENDVKFCLMANEFHPAYIEVDGKQVITEAGRKFLANLP